MKRGEVWWVDFDPSIGTEVQKLRPAVVVSNDAANRHLNRVQVVPITSNVNRLYPGEAFITLNGQKRKVMATQLTTASTLRLKSKLGELSGVDMNNIEQAIRIQLGL